MNYSYRKTVDKSKLLSPKEGDHSNSPLNGIDKL